MGKKLTTVLGTSGIILLLIAVVVGIYYFSGSHSQVAVGDCSGGTTILSISQASITTSQDLNGKQVLRVVAVANGGGECARIRWSQSDIEKALKDTGDNYAVDNEVYGDLILNEQTQTFHVESKPAQTVYKIAQNKKQTGLLCNVGNCEATYDNVIYAYRKYITGVGDCFCVYKMNEGQGGIFKSTSTKDFDVTFKIEGAGETHLTSTQQSAKLGSKAFIKWSGDLFSGTWLGTPNYDGFQRVSAQSWIMAEDGFYDDISDRFESDTKDDSDMYNKGCLVGGYKNVEGWIDFPYEQMGSCLDQYNSFVEGKLEDKTSDFEGSEEAVASGDWNGNAYTAVLAVPTTWQMFTIDLDASFVGIHKLVGEPAVSCPSAKQSVTSGKQVTSVFQVKDKSGTKPSFGLSLNCNNGIGSMQTNRITKVGTSYQNVNGYVTITTSSNQDFSCVFEAYDLNDPDNKDSCTSNYLGVPFSGCTAGETQCSSDFKQLGVCKSDGTDYTWSDCENGCDYVNGKATCLNQKKEICNDGVDNDNDNLIDDKDPDCKEKVCGAWLAVGDVTIIPDLWCYINNWIFKFRLALSIGIGLLSGLLGWLGFGKINRDYKLKAPKWVAPILGLLLAVGLGYLAFIYFWAGVVILIIFAVIKIFI